MPTAIASALLAALLSFLGRHDMAEWAVELGIQLVTAVLVFGLVVPRGLRHESAGGRGIVMAVVALLVVMPAFWTGVPLLLGAAAALLGFAGKRAEHGSGKAIVSFVLGVLAVVAYVAIYAGDFVISA